MLPEALVDLDALSWNYRFLREKAGKTEIGGVVKANAYGLGLAPVTRTLYAAGCRTFFTAHFTEALALREILPHASIVALSGFSEKDYVEAASRDIMPALNHLEAVETWGRFARAQEKILPAFIHLDTGMNRLGLPENEQKRLAENPGILEGIKVKAWMSHFACADLFDNPMTPEQKNRFVAALRRLPPAPASLCNSSGIFWGSDYLFDIARPGLALYGGNPTPHLPNPMRAVLEIQAPILQIRDVEPGMTVGYAASHRVTRRGRVGTLSLGYADGYHRTLGGKGAVRIENFSAPIIGRISMDLITVDVTDVPENIAHVGAMATVIGPHRTIDEAAAEANTICYELLTSLGPRILRRYKKAAGI